LTDFLFQKIKFFVSVSFYRAAREKRKKEKERRKREQEMNVKKKEKEKQMHKQKSLLGMNKKTEGLDDVRFNLLGFKEFHTRLNRSFKNLNLSRIFRLICFIDQFIVTRR
jgi:hypothetical protein